MQRRHKEESEQVDRCPQYPYTPSVITGAHLLFYSHNPEADRSFFSDVLGLRSVDAGHGWLIFALPPAEAAFHPADSEQPAQPSMIGADLYLLCDNLESQMKTLKEKNVVCGPVSEERWGIRTTITLPSGAMIGLYQPRHPTAIGLNT
jgi:hypothetical protein